MPTDMHQPCAMHRWKALVETAPMSTGCSCTLYMPAIPTEIRFRAALWADRVSAHLRRTSRPAFWRTRDHPRRFPCCPPVRVSSRSDHPCAACNPWMTTRSTNRNRRSARADCPQSLRRCTIDRLTSCSDRRHCVACPARFYRNLPLRRNTLTQHHSGPRESSNRVLRRCT